MMMGYYKKKKPRKRPSLMMDGFELVIKASWMILEDSKLQDGPRRSLRPPKASMLLRLPLKINTFLIQESSWHVLEDVASLLPMLSSCLGRMPRKRLLREDRWMQSKKKWKIF